MALGAFLAGVLLADSEYRHELEWTSSRSRPAARPLLPRRGMSVDLGLFVRSPLLILGLALGVVVLKMIILYPIARAFGYAAARRGLFAIALSQVASSPSCCSARRDGCFPRTPPRSQRHRGTSMIATPLLFLL